MTDILARGRRTVLPGAHMLVQGSLAETLAIKVGRVYMFHITIYYDILNSIKS